MKTKDSQILPAPPRLFETMVAGFDTITNHIALILFPIGLDLLIWLAPRLRIKGLIDRFVGDLVTQSLAVAPDVETTEMLVSAQELWEFAAEHFSLLAFLRSYPVGIPSLMVSILPLKTPIGDPEFIEVNGFGSMVLISILVSVLGLVFGALYFSTVAQAAVSGEIRWQKTLAEWPWLSRQVFLLALVWIVLLVGLSVPASCAISVATLSNLAFGQCTILMVAGLVVWIIFPLLFSSHGIFVKRLKVWPSIQRGIQITRMTLPTASLFFMSILLLTQGLDLLWRIPPEDSWLMLVGLGGHAFVTTGFLSASFIYYRDADQWLQSLQDHSEELTPEQA